VSEAVAIAPTAGRMQRLRRNQIVDLLARLIKEKPLGTFGFLIIVALLVTGIFANFLAPYGFNESDLYSRLAGPSAKHLLGADNLGRDLLSRIIYGARISMIIGITATTLNVVIGTIIGMTSGYIGGKFDLIVQRFVDAFNCIPALLLYLTIMAVIGQGIINLIIVMGISGGIGSSRMKRSAVMAIKQNAYVEAARAVGSKTGPILMRHVLPNIFMILIVSFSTGIGGVILQESTLSFLGFGVPPPFPSWGGMLSGAGRQYMVQAPWMMIWPGVALALVVYGANMLGDAVRDLTDPRLRGGLGRYGSSREDLLKRLSKKQNRAGDAAAAAKR
jgi:peptide/nickel transport system permease protein